MNPDIIFQHTSDAVIVTDPSFVVRAANPRAEGLLLRTAKELIGQPLVSCIPDLAGSPAENELRQYAGGKIERRVEHFSPTRYTWFEIRVVPHQSGLHLFVRDVTDRARQMRTEAVRAAVREVLIDAPIAISITRGPEHRYEMVNRFAQEIIGNRVVEGKKARDAFPDVDPALFAMLDEVYSRGERKIIEDLAVEFDRDGQRRKGWFDVTYQPLFDSDGSVSGIMSTSVETTAYRSERRARQDSAGPRDG